MHDPHPTDAGHLSLPVLEPPAGGLLRLQRAVAGRRGARAGIFRGEWSWITAGGLALSALLAFGLAPDIWHRHARNQWVAHALRHAMAPTPGGITIDNGAALRLPSNQTKVRVYLVQTSHASEAGPASAANPASAHR